MMLAGCMKVGPDYKAFDVALPDAWSQKIVNDVESPVSGSVLWWYKFGDPVLNWFILRARQANPNIYIASRRATEGWNQRKVLEAALFPKLDLYGSDSHGILTYDKDYINIDPSGGQETLGQFQYSWDLDVFGKTKRTVEAASRNYESKVEGWRDVMVFITSEVAFSYISYRTLQERLEVAKEGAAQFMKVRDKIRIREDLGVSSQLELKLASARYKTSQGEIPRLQQQLNLARNRLAELTALSLSETQVQLDRGRGIPIPPRTIATGVPADMLRSRPDIRRAERKVAKATAEVGVAEAMLYPDFSLSGALSYEFLRHGSVTTILDRVMGIGATVKWKLFRKGREQYRMKEFEAKLDQTYGEYQQVILKSLREVEDSMALLRYTKKRLNILLQASQDHLETADLMEEAYIVDEVDLQRMLNARQDQITVQDEREATRGRYAMHAVRLFKALGGGELKGAPVYVERKKADGEEKVR